MNRRHLFSFPICARYVHSCRLMNISSFIRNFIDTKCYSTITSRSYYEVLGVKPNATDDELKVAYYSMAKMYHPDLNVGNKNQKIKILEINEAFETLGNKVEREKYDSKMFPKESQRKPFHYSHGARPESQDEKSRRVREKVNYAQYSRNLKRKPFHYSHGARPESQDEKFRRVREEENYAQHSRNLEKEMERKLRYKFQKLYHELREAESFRKELERELVQDLQKTFRKSFNSDNISRKIYREVIKIL